MNEDPYSKRAKQEGHASRAIYKLKDIQRRFQLIQPGHCVLELGSAPGGWFPYVAKLVGSRGRLLGIDQLDMKVPIPEYAEFIMADFTDSVIDTKIEAFLSGRLFDVILSDAAPNTSGISFQDAARSAQLVEDALQLCSRFMKGGGCGCFKLFAGDEQAVIEVAKKMFSKVKRLKPEASKKKSREFYLICEEMLPWKDEGVA